MNERISQRLEAVREGLDQARLAISPFLPYPLSAYVGLKFTDAYQGQKPWVSFTSIPLTEGLRAVTSWRVRGRFPKRGKAAVGSNHNGIRDAAIIRRLAATQARRPVRFFIKESLVNPRAGESVQAQERRNREGGLLREEGKKGKFRFFKEAARDVVAWYLRLYDDYPVVIGASSLSPTNTRSFSRAHDDLEKGAMVIIFPQGTRRPPLDMLDTLGGTGLFLRNNPDVPFYPMGISWFGRRLVVNIGEPFTYREIPTDKSQKRSVAVEEYIAGKIAEQIADPRLKAAWLLKQRGFTKDQLREAYDRDPDLGAAESILRNYPPKEGEEQDLVLYLEEIDQAARF